VSLKNVIKRATLLSDGDQIEATSCRFEISHYNKLQFDKAPEPAAVNQVPNTVEDLRKPRVCIETTLKGASIDAEYEMILRALKKVISTKAKPPSC
jgi:two-component system response regulator HydG